VGAALGLVAVGCREVVDQIKKHAIERKVVVDEKPPTQ
jgi:hypothetical protein